MRHDSLNKTVIQGCFFGERRTGRPEQMEGGHDGGRAKNS